MRGIWKEFQPSTGSILTLEPDKPVGYVLILNKEKCLGNNAQVIFSTGSKLFYPYFGRKYVIREGHTIDASDYMSQPESMRAKWAPQVLKTVEAEAPGNPAARRFLSELKAQSEAANVSDEDASKANN
jgi:hypothetical protein